MNGHFQTGTEEGTGSAINVSMGYIPDYVKVFDEDGADHVVMEWVRSMGDGKGFKWVESTGTSHDFVSTNGISAYAGTDSVAEGFTIGADSDLNAADETLHWIAGRNEARDYDDI